MLAALVLSDLAGAAWPAGRELLVALAAGCLAYAGGSTFNDVFDADFDRKHRPERAIPQGVVSRGTAIAIGTLELAAGLGLFVRAGASPAMTGGLLAVILAYDWLHKRWSGSVLLMAGCRLLLAFTVATLPGHAFAPAFLAWAIAVYVYIVILSVLARLEYRGGGQAAKSGKRIGRMLAFIPLIDAIALLAVGAWQPALACVAAIPLGKWAQRLAAAT